MLVMMLVWACGSSAPGSCDQAEGTARDLCLQDGAQEQLRQDRPAQAEALIRQMSAGEARDLAWMAYARKTTLPVCGEVADADLQEHCRSLVGRMHMRGTEEAPTTTNTAGASVQGCPPSGLARDRCLAERAAQATTAAEAVGFCRALTSGDADGACRVDAAESMGEAGRLELGIAVCEGIAAARWQSECWFRFSESAEAADIGQRVAWCDRSDHYADECRVHLLDQEARRLSRLAPGQSLEQVLAAATERWTALATVGLDQGQGGDREGLFWTQYLHQLLRLSIGHGRPAAAHLRWVAQLPPARRADARDLVVRAWLRAEAPQLPGDGELLLQTLVARFESDAQAELSPRLPTRADRASGVSDGDRGRHQDTLGRLPWPLAPAAGCTLTAEERDRIALLWGAASLDHALAFAILRAGAVDPAPLVRAYALTAIEDRVFEWDRGGELGWGDVAEVLSERASAESDPVIRQRAIALVESLATRSPLEPLQGKQLCVPVKLERPR